MHNQSIKHEWTAEGIRVDLDCRDLKKDFGKAYDPSNKMVIQGVQIKKVSIGTGGDLMVHLREDGPPFLALRVVKIY